MDETEYDFDMLDDASPPSRELSPLQPPNVANPTSRSSVLTKIESIFESVVDVLLNERGQLSIALPTKAAQSKVQTEQGEPYPTQPESVQYIRFPGRNEREAWRFGTPSTASSSESSTDIE